MKKLVARFLALCLTLGCVGMALADDALEMSDVENITAPGVLPVAVERETLSIGIPQDQLVMSYDDNALTLRVEEATNVDLEFVFFPTTVEEARQKLALMVSANQEMPDVIVNLAITQADRASYGAQGAFIDLKDPVEKYTHFWKASVETWCTEEEAENITKMITSPDGGMYAFPFYYTDPTDPQTDAMWINKEWLDTLGLEMPTTTDELYEVLVAFRDKDPNGNGKQDEIPLVGADDWAAYPEMVLLNAFEYYTGRFYDHRLNADDEGKLYASYLTEGFRDGLRYMNKLYGEGLLSSLSFTQKYSGGLTALCDQDEAIVGAFIGHPHLAFTVGSPNRLRYTYVNPVTGPDGVCYVGKAVAMPYGNTFVTKDCENPALAVRVLDYFCDTNTSLSVRFGEEGTDWWVAEDPGSLQPGLKGMGFEVYFETPNLVVGTENRQMWNTWSTSLIPIKLFGSQAEVTSEDPNTQYRNSDYMDSVAGRMGKNPKNLVSRLIFTDDENLEINEMQATLRSFVDESVARFTMGDLNPEADWDNYVANAKAIGVDRFIEVAQGCYDRMNGN